MDPASDRAKVTCPKCDKQVFPGIPREQLDIDIRCPFCGYLLGAQEPVRKLIFEAIAEGEEEIGRK